MKKKLAANPRGVLGIFDKVYKYERVEKITPKGVKDVTKSFEGPGAVVALLQITSGEVRLMHQGASTRGTAVSFCIDGIDIVPSGLVLYHAAHRFYLRRVQ